MKILSNIGLLLCAVSAFGQQNLSSPVTALNTPSGSGEIRWRDTTGHYNSIKASATMSGNQTEIWPAANAVGVLTNNGTGGLSWGGGGPGACPAGANGQIQYYSGGSCAGSADLTWTASPGVLTVTGTIGDAAILVPSNAGFIQSNGGVYSNANVYNGFFSNTDGIVVPGFGVSTNGQTGGYFDFPMLVYPPSGTSPCYDAYGNLATYPNGLTGATYAQYAAFSISSVYAQYAVVTQGGSAYYSIAGGNVGHTPPNASFWEPIGGIIGAGLSDVIVWNGPSPLQGYVGVTPYHIDGIPCSPPPLTNPLNGLNVSSYVFARYGFAADVQSANAIQLYGGGASATSYYAGGFYFPGTVTNCCGTISTPEHLGGYMVVNATLGVPGDGTGCTSIASCNNPLIPGEGVGEGMFYEESATHHMTIFDASNWREVVYYNDSPTFGTVTATTFNSTATGATIAFQTTNTCTQINGNGDISVACGGLIADNSTTGGYSAPFNSARNVYSTAGGFESTCGIGGTQIVFSTANSDLEIDCQGNISVGGSGGSPYNGVVSTSSSTGGFNVTANTSPNSIQTVGGVEVFSGNPVLWQAYSASVLGVSGTSGIGLTNMGFVNPPAGLYQFNMYINQSVAATGCSATPGLNVGFAYNDGIYSGPGYLILAGLPSNTSIFNLSASAPVMFPFVSAPFRLDGGHLPQWLVQLFAPGSGCSNFGTYNAYVSLDRIG